MSQAGVDSDRVTRDRAFDVAVTWFLDGGRIEMRALSRALGVTALDVVPMVRQP